MNRENLSILKMKKFGENLKKMGRGDGLPRRCAPRNDRTGDAGPLRPLRGHLPRGGRQGSVGFSGLVLDPPVGELAAELTERAGYGLPRRGTPHNDRTGD